MTQPVSNLASNRVVSLSGLGRDRNPGHRILSECRDLLVNGLEKWLQEVATPISAELFVLADSTRERQQQTRYLDLRADIEKEWPHFVETFRRELVAQAERCQYKDTPAAPTSPASLDIPDFEGLQLVDDDELSEHIVIREFAAQLSETCDDELYTLNRRVAALLGHEEQIDSANPLAPQVICSALSDACASIGSDAEARLALLRRLERHLHVGLPAIYRQVNGYLIERGILPDLKRTYRRNTASMEITPASTAAPGANVASATPGASPAVPSGGEILDALQRIALARGGFGVPGTATAAGIAGGGVVANAGGASQLLLTSLNELQHAPAVDAGNVIVNQVRMVSESESAKRVGGLESVTIDVVAMLFDFIFDDIHIPVAIKALVSRLQIPVLKVAMLNPGFFADRQHPTRRFLGSVSGVSIRWGASVDETDPFYRKLEELVGRIQDEFENDVEIFGTALEELEAFVDEHERDEDTTALTAANLVIQRELESEAWDLAQRTVRMFCSASRLPPLLDDFLKNHWTAVLQKIAVAHGEQSDEWTAANQAMSDLAWSVQVKKNPADRLKLISLLPKLLALINKGLDNVSCPADQRNTFFDALVRLHSSALRGEIAIAPTAPPAEPAKPAAPVDAAAATDKPDAEGDLLVTRSIDNGIEVEEVMLVGGHPVWRTDEREIFRQVNELKRGDWVEFCDAEGNRSRERLNWISPQRGILLFSNHRSAKAISIAPDALVRQIRDGNATILLEEAIFERALSGALESISST